MRILSHIPEAVAFAPPVVSTQIGPLEQRPEGLDAVGVGLAPDVLTGAMADCFPLLGDGVVATEFIGVDRGGHVHVLTHHSLERGHVGPFYRGGSHGAVSSLHAYYSLLPHRPTATAATLVIVPVALLAAKVGLIHLDFAGQGVLAMVASLPDPLLEEPGAFLGDAKLFSKLDAADTLLGSGHYVEGQ